MFICYIIKKDGENVFESYIYQIVLDYIFFFKLVIMIKEGIQCIYVNQFFYLELVMVLDVVKVYLLYGKGMNVIVKILYCKKK